MYSSSYPLVRLSHSTVIGQGNCHIQRSEKFFVRYNVHHHHHHHHHIHDGLGVFLVTWSSRCSWSLHLFLGHPTFLRPFGLYCSARFGSLFVSILFTCCSHFSWYCFISFTMFCAPVFSPQYMDSFLYLVLLFPVSVSKISSKCCSCHFLSTQASLPNFNAALAVILWILNFVSLFICFPKCLCIALFILLYVCSLSSKSLLYSGIQYPRYFKSVTCSIILSFITVFTLRMWFPHIAIAFVFVLYIVILYFLAVRFRWYAIVCKSFLFKLIGRESFISCLLSNVSWKLEESGVFGQRFLSDRILLPPFKNLHSRSERT